MERRGCKVLEALEAGLHARAGGMVYAMTEGRGIAIRLKRVADGAAEDFWSDTQMSVSCFYAQIVDGMSDGDYTALMADLALNRTRDGDAAQR